MGMPHFCQPTSFLTYGHRSRKHVHMRPIHRWSTRATHAVIMRIPVHALPWCATPFSDGTVLVYRSGAALHS